MRRALLLRQVVFIVTVCLSLWCTKANAATGYLGLEPGVSTRAHVERTLGGETSRISATMSEYPPKDAGTQRIVVEYASDGNLVERIEVYFTKPESRDRVARSLNLGPPTSTTREVWLREFYAAPNFVVFNYLGDDPSSGIVSAAYYSRASFERNLANRASRLPTGAAADVSTPLSQVGKLAPPNAPDRPPTSASGAGGAANPPKGPPPKTGSAQPTAGGTGAAGGATAKGGGTAQGGGTTPGNTPPKGPPGPPVATGSGGTTCVFRYQLFGDAPNCYNFVATACTASYSKDKAYTVVGQSMTAGEADKRIGELSSYYEDAYKCRASAPPPPPSAQPPAPKPAPPPPPPAVVQKGGGGPYCVYRYKLFGDPPACFHFVAAGCGSYGPPNYESVGANMSAGEAEKRIGELSRYFDNAYGCNIPPPPPPAPPAPASGGAGSGNTAGDPPPPPPPPATPPPTPPPPPPARPVLSRFGFANRVITIKVGDTASPQVYATYSDAPDNVVDVTGQVTWPGGRALPFTARTGDEGKTFSFTALLDGVSDTVTVNVIADTSNTTNTPPDIFAGTTTTTETSNVERTPPPSPPAGDSRLPERTPPPPGGARVTSGPDPSVTGGPAREREEKHGPFVVPPGVWVSTGIEIRQGDIIRWEGGGRMTVRDGDWSGLKDWGPLSGGWDGRWMLTWAVGDGPGWDGVREGVLRLVAAHNSNEPPRDPRHELDAKISGAYTIYVYIRHRQR